MKKILFLIILIDFAFTPSGYASTILHKNYSDLNTSLKPLLLHELVTLTPRRYRKLTGEKMTLKEKIFLKILQIKLKKRLFDNKGIPDRRTKKPTLKFPYGAISLLSGIAGGIIILIAIWSIVPYILAAAAVVFGITGLRKNKNDIASLLGLILGGLFYFLLLLGLIFLNRLK